MGGREGEWAGASLCNKHGHRPLNKRLPSEFDNRGMKYFAIVFYVLAWLLDPAHAATVTVTTEDCRHIVSHTPDISVAYTPGVDAYGRPVAPATLGGGFSVKPPEKFTMDINIDLQERFGLPANKGQYMGEIKVGQVEIRKDGHAFYNSQELATGAQNEITRACRELQKR